MKQPAVKLTTVYKVVQVDKGGRMWSVNPNGDLPTHYCCVEYFLNHQVLPHADRPTLFVTPNLQQAQMAAKFYNRGHVSDWEHKISILRCLAANVRQQTLDYVTIGLGENQRQVYTPTEFKTSLCDWLVPVAVIPTKNRK
jgi:hypothetical protein